MASVPFILGELSESDIEWLAGIGSVERVEKGMPLIHQGEDSSALFVVLTGQLAVAQIGDVRELAELAAGEMVGEMSFLESRPPSADVRAASDECRVLRLSLDALGARLKDDEGFAARFYRGLAHALSARLRAAVRALTDRPQEDAAVDPEGARERARARLEKLLDLVS